MFVWNGHGTATVAAFTRVMSYEVIIWKKAVKWTTSPAEKGSADGKVKKPDEPDSDSGPALDPAPGLNSDSGTAPYSYSSHALDSILGLSGRYALAGGGSGVRQGRYPLPQRVVRRTSICNRPSLNTTEFELTTAESRRKSRVSPATENHPPRTPANCPHSA
ncbi:hypothetical protein EVAR_67149_1 [Eumeta japonica]|uniref:Uncharacterized protein n=1 Tax=Eumeta variegata TaxID=151549 RepID=A0A4C1ZXW3_EUMVA|nr:hypothetical protein EVAR_67149_1 [Eumeta japonica]